VIGWKPFRASRPVGQDHCSPPFFGRTEHQARSTLKHESVPVTGIRHLRRRVCVAQKPVAREALPAGFEGLRRRARTRDSAGQPVFQGRSVDHEGSTPFPSPYFCFSRVAQKQGNRLITDRPRSVTVREDHFISICGGLISEAESRVANAYGDFVSLRGRTSALRHFSFLPGRLIAGRRTLTPRMHVRLVPRQPISLSASIGRDAAVS
jgi:hypothetical protein